MPSDIIGAEILDENRNFVSKKAHCLQILFLAMK